MNSYNKLQTDIINLKLDVRQLKTSGAGIECDLRNKIALVYPDMEEGYQNLIGRIDATDKISKIHNKNTHNNRDDICSLKTDVSELKDRIKALEIGHNHKVFPIQLFRDAIQSQSKVDLEVIGYKTGVNIIEDCTIVSVNKLNKYFCIYFSDGELSRKIPFEKFISIKFHEIKIPKFKSKDIPIELLHKAFKNGDKIDVELKNGVKYNNQTITTFNKTYEYIMLYGCRNMIYFKNIIAIKFHEDDSMAEIVAEAHKEQLSVNIDANGYIYTNVKIIEVYQKYIMICSIDDVFYNIDKTNLRSIKIIDDIELILVNLREAKIKNIKITVVKTNGYKYKDCYIIEINSDTESVIINCNENIIILKFDKILRIKFPELMTELKALDLTRQQWINMRDHNYHNNKDKSKWLKDSYKYDCPCCEYVNQNYPTIQIDGYSGICKTVCPLRALWPNGCTYIDSPYYPYTENNGNSNDAQKIIDGCNDAMNKIKDF
jgi:hypothetical protein